MTARSTGSAGSAPTTSRADRLHRARRRGNATMLRWQARLDTPLADRVIPWTAATALSALFAVLSLSRARSLDADASLAQAVQTVWVLREGGSAVSLDGGAHALAPHQSLLLWPLAQLTRLVPIEPTLLVIQAVALGLAVVPLWLLARQVANLRVGAAAALVVAYALYPAVHGVNLSGFHVAALALPLLVLAVWAGLDDHPAVLVVACVAIVLARADLGLAVAGVGLVLLANGRRRPGTAAVVGGLGFTTVAALIVQPLLDSDSPHLRAFADYGDTPVGVLWGLVSQPGDVVSDLLAEPNLDLLVLLLGPLLFLPVLVPRFLVGVVPVGVATLIAAAPGDPLWSGRTVPLTAMLFVATTFALHRMGRAGVSRVIVDRRLLLAVMLASLTFFVQAGTASPYRRPWEWGGRDRTDQVRLTVVDVIEPGDSVRSASSVATSLAERSSLSLLDPGDRPDPEAAADGVDVVVVDEHLLDDWTAVQQRILVDGIEARGFDRVLDREGIIVLRRAGA